MYKIPTLPLKQEIETKPVLKQLVEAHKCLAELKGAVKSMPNAAGSKGQFRRGKHHHDT